MNDSTELYYAEMEAARHNAEIGYFNARPHKDTPANRAIFRDGFERAFRILWNQLPASGQAQTVPRTLLDFGYAPGGYLSECFTCKRGIANVDKRCFCCRECAQAKLDKWNEGQASVDVQAGRVE